MSSPHKEMNDFSMCLRANCQEQYFGSSTSIVSFFWKY